MCYRGVIPRSCGTFFVANSILRLKKSERKNIFWKKKRKMPNFYEKNM